MIDDSVLTAVMMTEKIIESHQSARDLYGREFESKIKPFRNAVQTLIVRHGSDITSAGLLLMQNLRDMDILDSIGVMMVAAAVYDLQEQAPAASDLEP